MSLEEVFALVNQWQESVFTEATPQSIATHLREEAEELEREPESDKELADVLILAAALIHWRKVDAPAIVLAKLEVNQARTWGKPDKNGVVHHVKSLAEETFAAGPDYRFAAAPAPDYTLASCPFCGETPVLECQGDYYVKCWGCGAMSTDAANANYVIWIWNKRGKHVADQVQEKSR